MVLKKAFSYIRYSIQKWGKNYNVIERKDKIIESEKLCGAAPRHTGTQEKIDVILKERPEIKENVKIMPQGHLHRLTNVRVESDALAPNPESGNSAGDLPHSREIHKTPLYGYEVPKFIPEGKCSLQQALSFITDNINSPQSCTANVIAEKYKMKVMDVQNIINNFRTLEYHYVTPTKKKASIAKEAMEVLGVMKIKDREPNMYQKFAHLEEGRKKIAETEEKTSKLEK